MYDLNLSIKTFVKATRLFFFAPFLIKNDSLIPSVPLRWVSIVVFACSTGIEFYFHIFLNTPKTSINGYQLISLLRISLLWILCSTCEVQVIRHWKTQLSIIQKIKEIDSFFKTEEKTYKKIYLAVNITLIWLIIFFCIFTYSGYSVKFGTPFQRTVTSFFVGLSLQSMLISETQWVLLVMIIKFYIKKLHREMEFMTVRPENSEKHLKCVLSS